MIIDNFSVALLDKLVCPVSREPLHYDGSDLISSSGYRYSKGDFRLVSSATQSPEWIKGQKHYEEYMDKWIANGESYFKESDLETVQIYEEIPIIGSVLDVGGGFGTLVNHANLDPANVICIDPMICIWDNVPSGAFKSHYKNLEKIIRIPGFAEDVPLPNNSIDTVHMRSCLDHFANPHRALLEARRVLKPNGKLVVGLALEGSYKLVGSGFVNNAKRVIKNSLVGEIYEYFFDAHMFHPTEESLKELVKSSGFEITKWILQSGYSNVVYLSASKSGQ
jgi:ubiquinone/menaquinone biosynthesis C-methylase UbiE